MNDITSVITFLASSFNNLLCLSQDGLIQQCGETMKENVNVKTVCSYYNSATMYGLDSVMKKSVVLSACLSGSSLTHMQRNKHVACSLCIAGV